MQTLIDMTPTIVALYGELGCLKMYKPCPLVCKFLLQRL